MYCVKGASRSSLLMESTDSMITLLCHFNEAVTLEGADPGGSWGAADSPLGFNKGGPGVTPIFQICARNG